ncbi:MAG: TlpA family protein disulfide reductase [Rhodothermales bacterium]|nr:TlpA family protein disulfide reductase [Rhodothermales bacterium]
MRRSTRSSCVRALLGVSILLLMLGGCGKTDSTEGADPRGASDKPVAERGTARAPGSSTLEMPAPEFSLPTMTGDSLTTADLRGRITLVNFWATWCGPCVVEMPELIGLQAEWSSRPFQVVGVSMDSEGFDIVRPFAEDFGVNYPVVLDKGPLADAFGGVYGLPTTFVVGADGTILHRYIGLFPMDEVRVELDRMVRALES